MKKKPEFYFAGRIIRLNSESFTSFRKQAYFMDDAKFIEFLSNIDDWFFKNRVEKGWYFRLSGIIEKERQRIDRAGARSL